MFYAIPSGINAARGIRLADANPGVYQGEQRLIWVYSKIDEARERHPFSQIAEVQVPASHVRAAQTSGERWRVDENTQARYALPPTRFGLHADIAPEWVGEIHASARELCHTPQSSAQQPHPMSDEGLLLNAGTESAIRRLKAVSASISSHVHSLHFSEEAASRTASAWHEYYKTMPGLENFVAAQTPNISRAPSEYRSTGESWASGMEAGLSDVSALSVGFNDNYIAGVADHVAKAQGHVARVANAGRLGERAACPTLLDACACLNMAVARLADHQEMVMGVYHGSRELGERARVKGWPQIQDVEQQIGPIPFDKPKS
jgi:hypothetical protein